MRPEFAKAIAPALITAIDFLERLPSMDMTSGNAARGGVERAIEAAESRLSGTDAWRRAKYAIVAMVDEECIETNWAGRDYWVEHSLEHRYFPEGGKISHDNFYLEAEQAMAARDRDSLEAFFICVVLGFRGIYADIDSPDETLRDRAREFVNSNRLPGTLEGWTKRVGGSIKHQIKQQISDSSDESEGAPPLEAKSNLISSLLFAMIGLGALIGYSLFKLIS